MTAPPELPGSNDPGLVALVMLLRFHGVGADPAQIRHQCGTAAIGTADMIRCGKELGLKARELKSSWARLATTPLPAIAYRIDGPEVLHDVNFSVSAGQVIGMVGPSGSGKSTVAKLIQRLYIPESGRVLVDGVDLAMVDTSRLRRQIGAVLQENVLFNQSIRDNIALPDPAMPIERVVEAAKLAGAHDFILELPEGYDTIVGERGSSLSGGQRQRIAIARALVTNPRILIFDEATSALDYESERVIQDNMARIAQGRTVFIIAHACPPCAAATASSPSIAAGWWRTERTTGGRYAALHRVQAGLHEVQ
jgi:subfamily B ATP-binding cassette protein HlyB/CyaB